MIKLDIQLFADEPTEEEELLERLGVKKTDQEETPEEVETAPEEETEEETPEEETPEEETEEETPEEEVEDSKGKGGISELRKKQREDAKRLKELEEEKKKLEEEAARTKKKLLKAVRLGIKGETEEEILENLEEFEVKEEAKTKGLTEEQIKKEKEIEEKMQSLSQRERQIIFNQRSFDMQKTLGLTNEQVMEFIEMSANTGINLETTPVDFKIIYNRIMPKESLDPQSLEELRKENERLKKELEAFKKTQAPGASPKGGKTKTISDDDWLKQFRESGE